MDVFNKNSIFLAFGIFATGWRRVVDVDRATERAKVFERSKRTDVLTFSNGWRASKRDQHLKLTQKDTESKIVVDLMI